MWSQSPFRSLVLGLSMGVDLSGRNPHDAESVESARWRRPIKVKIGQFHQDQVDKPKSHFSVKLSRCDEFENDSSALCKVVSSFYLLKKLTENLSRKRPVEAGNSYNAFFLISRKARFAS